VFRLPAGGAPGTGYAGKRRAGPHQPAGQPPGNKMQHTDLDISAATPASLTHVHGDDGARVPPDSRRMEAYRAQLAIGEAYEVRRKGELVCLCGFGWREDLQAMEGWFLSGPAMKRFVRAGIDAAAGIAMAVWQRHGAVIARVRQAGAPGADRSARLVRLMGFDPAGVREDGFDLYLFNPGKVF
tara:strand:- start:3295 stop:3846 length:552 start_codon:yes stop_codon:yes gene_type:complete